jgi:hypothetical protein
VPRLGLQRTRTGSVRTSRRFMLDLPSRVGLPHSQPSPPSFRRWPVSINRRTMVPKGWVASLGARVRLTHLRCATGTAADRARHPGPPTPRTESRFRRYRFSETTSTRRRRSYWQRYLANDAQSEWAARARRSLRFCEMQVHFEFLTANSGGDVTQLDPQHWS